MSKPLGEYVKPLALMMSVICVRNTVIEDYHARGSLSQDDMKAFNQEVANKIYTFLVFLMDRPEVERDRFIDMAVMFFPSNWDEPHLDADLMEAFELSKRAKTGRTSEGD